MKTTTFKRSFIVIAMILVTAATSWAYYNKFCVNGIYYGSNSDGKTVHVTYKDNNFNSYSGSVVIPSTVTYSGTTYPVTYIGNYAFSDCSGLTSVTIPNSVTLIGSYAFYGCSGLTSVTIPNSVTKIGDFAFYGCSGLTKVEISDIAAWCKISFAGYNANPLRYALHLYQNGKEVTNLVIPNSVTSIGSLAFFGCSGLTSVTIPNSVTEIGQEAFKDCSGLKSVTIGNSVTSIGSSAFCGCSGLSSVTIGNSVTLIGNSAFWDCDGLTSVTIPNSVTSIGSSAFCGCSGLTKVEISDIAAWCNISFGSNDANPLYNAEHLYLNGKEVTNLVIPNSVTSIGGWAFYNCSGLKSVTIPNSVTSIGEKAFSGCSGLTSVTIPNSVTSIGVSAFYSTAWYKNQPDGLVYAGKVAYKYKGTMPDNTSITIKDGTLGIAGGAFEDCSGLTSVTIPNSVTSIGESAFYGCSGLTSVTIPNSVTSIGNFAFYKCSDLTSVTIGNSVTSIGDWAFYNCIGLTSVTIPNSVTSIGNCAFYKCSGLTSVTIGNSVTSIGDWAFEGCTKILSFTSQNVTPPVTSESAFKGVPRSCQLYVPASSKVAYQTAIGWSLFTSINDIEDGDIATIDSDSVSVTTAGGAIRVEGAEGAEAEVYSLSGALLYRGTDSTIALPRGVYIVKVAETTTKVIL